MERAVGSEMPVKVSEESTRWKIDVESVRVLYEDWIIPLTKEVEVRVLLVYLHARRSYFADPSADPGPVLAS